jgi:hypothetical protein
MMDSVDSRSSVMEFTAFWKFRGKVADRCLGRSGRFYHIATAFGMEEGGRSRADGRTHRDGRADFGRCHGGRRRTEQGTGSRDGSEVITGDHG